MRHQDHTQNSHSNRSQHSYRGYVGGGQHDGDHRGKKYRVQEDEDRFVNEGGQNGNRNQPRDEEGRFTQRRGDFDNRRSRSSGYSGGSGESNVRGYGSDDQYANDHGDNGYDEMGGTSFGYDQGDVDRPRSRRTPHDEDYHYWRNEQLSKLDSEYDEWRKDRRQKFSDDFNKWREERAAKQQGSDTNKK